MKSENHIHDLLRIRSGPEDFSDFSRMAFAIAHGDLQIGSAVQTSLPHEFWLQCANARPAEAIWQHSLLATPCWPVVDVFSISV